MVRYNEAKSLQNQWRGWDLLHHLYYRGGKELVGAFDP
jgi:hypothetical protein